MLNFHLHFYKILKSEKILKHARPFFFIDVKITIPTDIFISYNRTALLERNGFSKTISNVMDVTLFHDDANMVCTATSPIIEGWLNLFFYSRKYKFSAPNLSYNAFLRTVLWQYLTNRADQYSLQGKYN